MNDNFKHDVALSFASEDRDYVEKVEKELKKNGVRVFYDKGEEVNLWGKNLTDEFSDTYANQANYVVMFISKFYVQKPWTNFERKTALSRALKENREYILPARFDDTEVPSIPSTVHHISLQNLKPEDFAKIIIQKVKGIESVQVAPVAEEYRKPKVQKINFNPYEEGIKLINTVMDTLKKRCDESGVSSTVINTSDVRKCLKVVHAGKSVYSLALAMGSFGNDSSITISKGTNVISDNSYNGICSLKPAKNGEDLEIHFSINPFSLYSQSNEGYKVTKLVSKVWDEICEEIERRVN